MASLSALRDVLRTRVRLSLPDKEPDTIYKFEDGDLDLMLQKAAPVHNPSYDTIEKVPPGEEPFVLWLAEIEVYFALAAGNSRFYRISAEGGTEINKQERVRHYLDLAEGRQKHYDTMWSHFKEVNPHQVELGELIVRSRVGLGRAYRLTERPSTVLSVVRKTQDTVDLQWTPFVKSKARFTVYQDNGLIVDEWEHPVWANGVFVPIVKSAKSVWTTIDSQVTKLRVRSLSPGTTYHFAIIVQDALGKWGFSEVTVTTDAPPPEVTS